MHDIVNVIILITIETGIVLGTLAGLCAMAWAMRHFHISRKTANFNNRLQ